MESKKYAVKDKNLSGTKQNFLTEKVYICRKQSYRYEAYISDWIYGSRKNHCGKSAVPAVGTLVYRSGPLYRRSHHKTVGQLFAEKGEDAFRDIERRMLREVAAFEDVLVSTGGGAPCFFDNMEFMNGAGQTVYLKVSVEELAKRLELCKSTRPILEGRSGDELRAFIAESLEKREPFYSKASIVFDAEEMMTDQDVYKISQELATRL